MSQRSDRYRLAMDTLLAPTTIDRVLRGDHVRPSTRRLVEIAARKLRITLPDVSSSTSRGASQEAA